MTPGISGGGQVPSAITLLLDSEVNEWPWRGSAEAHTVSSDGAVWDQWIRAFLVVVCIVRLTRASCGPRAPLSSLSRSRRLSLRLSQTTLSVALLTCAATSYLSQLALPAPTSGRPAEKTHLGFVTHAAAAKLPRCIELQYNSGLNGALIDRSFGPHESYFCADTAPQQFACSCGVMDACKHQPDMFGRNLGHCSCCRTWVWALIVVSIISAVLLLITVAAYCCLSVRWFFAGYPDPIKFLIPRDRGSTVCPPDRPAPDGFFTGYPSSHFANFYSAEYQQRMQDEAERAAAQLANRNGDDDSASREGKGPRRRNGGQQHTGASQTSISRLQQVAAATPPKQPFGARMQSEFAKRAEEKPRAKEREAAVEPFAVEERSHARADAAPPMYSPAEKSLNGDSAAGNSNSFGTGLPADSEQQGGSREPVPVGPSPPAAHNHRVPRWMRNAGGSDSHRHRSGNRDSDRASERHPREPYT